MKKTSIIVVIGSMLVAGLASAEELPSSARSRANSASGQSLASAKREVVAVRNVLAEKAVSELATAFVSKGLLKTSSKGRTYEWHTEQHPSLPRIVLRRLASAAQFEPTPEEAMRDLRASQAAVEMSSLPTRAESVIQAVRSQVGVSSDETFVPISAGKATLHIANKDSGESETLITHYRVVYRRYFDGVPVLGRAGEFDITFDADGEVEAIEIPSDRYEASGKTLKALSGAQTVRALVKRAGFDHVPTNRNENAKKDGDTANVEEMHCGFVDDGSAPKLGRGCLLRYAWHGRHEDILPAD